MHNVNATSNAFGNGIFDGWSIVTGHEYSEAVTDPDNIASWQDGWLDAQGSENGDKCAWDEHAEHHARRSRVRRAADVEQRGLRRDRQRLRPESLRETTMRKRIRAAGLLAVTAALVTGVAVAAGGPSVTITSPGAGQKVSARHSTYVAVAGTASFATPAATTTRFYLRRDGCGTASDNPHLSVTSGTDGGDGCGSS